MDENTTVETQEVETNEEVYTPELSDESDTDITLEDYYALKDRLSKAERLIVEQKRQSKLEKKEVKSASNETDEKKLERLLDEREFFKENPEFVDYKKQLEEYTKLGIPIKKAALLVKEDDPTFWNRQKANEMNVTNWEASPTKTAYTKAELAKMSQADYVKAMEAIEGWKAKIKP